MEQLYNESIKLITEGSTVKGKIVSVKQKEVLVDVGFKSEGVVPITEFKPEELAVGNELDFFVNSIEDEYGMISLSREKARCMQGWDSIVAHSASGELMEGKPVKKVKGGFIVEVMGMEGFLPASLSAFKGMMDKDILGHTFKFKIIKINKLRYGIILSRREAIQKEREEQKRRYGSILR